jgi:hypothetical protein
MGTKQQKRGQLMGSITSFPILCMINAAVCRWACELADRRVWSLNDVRLAVNGDDCVFRADKSVYKFWQQLGKAVGLEESLGKTYVSRDFIEINSTMYKKLDEGQYDMLSFYDKKNDTWVDTLCCFRHIKAVNFGLIKGLKRSAGVAGLVDPTDGRTLGSLARDLVRNCPPNMKDSVMEMFIKENILKLKDEKLRNIPWYIPEWLGGLGLPTFSKGQPSDLDLRLLRGVLNGLKDPKYHPIELSKVTPEWKTYMEAQARMPEPFTKDEKSANSDYYDHVIGIKCIDLLFDSNIGLAQLAPGLTLKADEKDRAKIKTYGQVLKKNAKIWSPKRFQDSLPEPMKLEEVEKYGIYRCYTAPQGYRSAFQSEKVRKDFSPFHEFCGELLD